MKKKNDIKIYCGFNKSLPQFEEVLSDVFVDYLEKKKKEKSNNKVLADDCQNKNYNV